MAATTPLAGEEVRVAATDCRYGSNPSGQFIPGIFQPYPQYPCLSSQPIPFEMTAKRAVLSSQLRCLAYCRDIIYILSDINISLISCPLPVFFCFSSVHRQASFIGRAKKTRFVHTKTNNGSNPFVFTYVGHN
jgi:hypothetical protein